jgi:hypothetical protein
LKSALVASLKQRSTGALTQVVKRIVIIAQTESRGGRDARDCLARTSPFVVGCSNRHKRGLAVSQNTFKPETTRANPWSAMFGPGGENGRERAGDLIFPSLCGLEQVLHSKLQLAIIDLCRRDLAKRTGSKRSSWIRELRGVQSVEGFEAHLQVMALRIRHHEVLHH